MDIGALPKPVNVSPLIRFARWSLLISGIFYGVHRKNYLKKFEEKRRRDNKARLEARIFNQKVNSLEAYRTSIVKLAKDFDYILPSEWYKPCFGKPCQEAVKGK